MITVTWYFVDLCGDTHYLFASFTVEVNVSGHIQNSTPAADNVLNLKDKFTLKYSVAF